MWRASILGLLIALAGPAEARKLREHLVDVTEVIPDAVIDMRYATENNFTKHAVYPKSVCKLWSGVAERLAKAAELLRAQHRRLLIWDCYRPLDVQKTFWELVPDERYVADPAKGSRHNRGAAIDLALVDADGNAVVLPTEFDDFSTAAHRKTALAGKKGIEAKRLEKAMKKAGFIGIATEWWHFDAPDAAKFPVSNEPL